MSLFTTVSVEIGRYNMIYLKSLQWLLTEVSLIPNSSTVTAVYDYLISNINQPYSQNKIINKYS